MAAFFSGMSLFASFMCAMSVARCEEGEVGRALFFIALLFANCVFFVTYLLRAMEDCDLCIRPRTK
jgi:hypothetical protein